jgi:hypothetical protein
LADPEDGGSTFLPMSMNVYGTIRRYFPEDKTLELTMATRFEKEFEKQ